MNRKLHNTFAALIASSVLMLGMVTAPPVAPQAAPAASMLAAASPSATATTPASADAARATLEPALAARLDAVALQLRPRANRPQAQAGTDATVATTVASTFEDTAAAPAALQASRHKSGKSRRIRQSMAMPFFSFAPRG